MHDLTTVKVIPIHEDGGHAVGQALTKSSEWKGQFSRDNLAFHALQKALRKSGMGGVADILEAQSAYCAFCYEHDSYCGQHKDKSSARRLMVRLVEDPRTQHSLMIQPKAGGPVYDIVMEGQSAYHCADPSALSRMTHAVPTAKGEGGRTITLLISLTGAVEDVLPALVAALKIHKSDPSGWSKYVLSGYIRCALDFTPSQRDLGRELSHFHRLFIDPPRCLVVLLL